MKILLAALLSLTTISCTTLENYSAELGQLSDSATTVWFVNNGVEEANPVIAGNWWLLALKPFIPTIYRYAVLNTGVEDAEAACALGNRAIGHIGYFAAGWNIGVTSLGGGPVAVATAIGLTLLAYKVLENGSNRVCGYQPEAAPVKEVPYVPRETAPSNFLE